MTDTEFEAFINSLRAPGTTQICPKQVCRAMNLSAKDLAQATQPGRSVNTAIGRHAAHTQRALRDLVRILCAARNNHEMPEDLLYWFMNYPIQHFQYRTAFEVYAAARTEELLMLLTTDQQRKGETPVSATGSR